MTEYTDHYGLSRLTEDDLSVDSFKFSDGDRILIDRLLYLGAEGHHHTGGTASDDAPDLSPNLTLSTSTGSIPAGTRVYYKYTYVDGDGLETTASPESWIDTPSAVAAPAAPDLSTTSTGGTLQPGTYLYLLTAYTDFNDLETTAGTAASISVPYVTETNVITLDLPILPSGADGFNVYVKGPGNVGYRYLTSINMNVATPPTEFEDDGGYNKDCDRPPPTSNLTTSTNSVLVDLPETLPLGFQWRLYRTYNTGDYTNSLLTTTTAADYTDLGGATTVGEPPPVGAAVGSPEKVLLTGAAEVQGVLPLANVIGFPYHFTFSQHGSVVTEAGSHVWLAPFAGTIVNVRASLGAGSVVVGTLPIIVDIHRGSGVNPTYTTIFTTQANRPSIPVGQQVGAAAVPDIVSFSAGDTLIMDIDQDESTATPMATDLTVHVYVLADF